MNRIESLALRTGHYAQECGRGASTDRATRHTRSFSVTGEEISCEVCNTVAIRTRHYGYDIEKRSRVTNRAAHIRSLALGFAGDAIVDGVSAQAGSKDDGVFVAIIGMACRFPGAPNLDALWNLLIEGRETVGEYPRGRSAAMDAFYDAWGTPDGPVGLHSGTLPQLKQFDADFFSISPREAAFVDPQQRLLLELGWEAFEDAGKTRTETSGSDTGVYAGVWSSDYLTLIHETQEASLLGQNGGALYSASGRLAFAFDLRGPEATVNLGCASGLVAVHLACEALRSGQCGMALAGAANAILDPGVSLAFTRGGVLSPDGRCKFGDSTADGFVRSEGAGMFVLKLLSNATKDGDRIHAVIRGSAVANNGGSSQTLMTPSPVGQRNVLKRACEAARISPAELDYIEAHGTGTSVGDPIEISAISEIVGRDPERTARCVIGSVKSNLGHTESVSGIAGMMKTILAIQHRFIPRSLHVKELNPAVDWETSGLQLETEGCAWPTTGGPARAGVSSFGLTGTNAHLILEEAPSAVHALADRREWILPMSAHSAEALRELAGSWRDRLPTESALANLCFTAATRRTALPHRLAAAGTTGTEMSQAIAQWLSGEDAPTIHHAIAAGQEAGIVFVFPGQGSQWLGMGQGLLRNEPVFRRSIEESDAVLRKECGWSLLEYLVDAEANPVSSAISVVQPALFAIQVALARLWISWGVTPSVVVGHSMGEVAAAHIAGVLSMEDAAAVIGRRSRLLQRVSGSGAMAMIELSPDEAEEAIRGFETRVSVAVNNGQQATVLSGEPDAIARIVASLERRQVFCRMLKVDVASHSPQMVPLLAELEALLDTIHPQEAVIPLHSTTLGRVLTSERMDGAYWCENLRRPVLFHAATDSLIKQGFATFLEISPHPSLSPYIEQTAASNGKSVMALGSLRRDEPELPALLDTLGKLFTHGYPVDWSGLYPSGNPVDLPAFPWQRQTYWLEEKHPGALHRAVKTGDSFLGEPIVTADKKWAWNLEIDLAKMPWLRDHVVGSSVLLPASVFAQIALEALAVVTYPSHGVIEDLSIEEAMPLSSDRSNQVQVRVDGEPLGRFTFKVYFRADEAEGWTQAAKGILDTTTFPVSGSAVDLRQFSNPKPGERKIDADQHERAMRWRGYNFGPHFLRLQGYILRGHEAVAEARLAQGFSTSQPASVHPVLLDAGFQLLIALYFDHRPRSGRLLPVRMGRLESFSGAISQQAVFIRAELRENDSPDGDLLFFNKEGDLLLRVTNLVFAAAGHGLNPQTEKLFYELKWEAAKLPATHGDAPESSWLIFADRSGTGERLAHTLRRRRHTVRLVADSRISQNETSGEQRAFFLHELRAARTYRTLQVVHLRSLDLLSDGSIRYAEEDCAAIATLTQTLIQTLLEDGAGAQLNLITRGAVATNTVDPISVLQSSAWGLGAVIATEHPQLQCRCIDLAATPNPDEVDDLAAELMTHTTEDRVALRAGSRLVSRLRPMGQGIETAPLRRPPSRKIVDGEAFELEQQSRGVLDSFALRSFARSEPGRHEVEIEIRASGLNFRDVLQALDSLEDAAATHAALGLEASGVITRLGRSIENLHVGDEVMTLSSGSNRRTLFTSHAIVSARLVIAKPKSLSSEQAGAFPAAFLTAYIGLFKLAQLRKGERVLIHSATGGVGLAAIQIAHWLGAEIFATAGSEEKRACLSGLGIEHVMDSRSSGFAKYIERATAGQGVDIVLNSLAGDAIAEGLQALAPYGRFVELGKRDMARDTKLGYSAFTRNRTLIGFDLATMAEDRPDFVAASLKELAGLVNAGVLQPLPCRVFPVSEASAAFQWMAASSHIGKVVLDMRDSAARVLVDRNPVRASATYLVTGGTGALGWETAKELVRLGAKHLVLTSRSAPSPVIAGQVDILRAHGAEVRIHNADVGDEAQLTMLLGQIAETMPPLRGIIHCAGVIDDALVANLELRHFHVAMHGKSEGALLLDRLTRGYSGGYALDMFVMYSSVAALLGTPGQGNYAAANSILDALAHDRLQRGLPATSINWGPWSSIGLAAASSNRGERMAGQGLASIGPHEGIHLLTQILSGPQIPQVAAMHFERKHWIAPDAPLLSFLSKHKHDTEATANASLDLRSMSAARALSTIEKLLIEQTAAVVRMQPARIPRSTSFRSIGLDSLMGLELRNRLEARLSLRLAASTIWNYPTIEALTAHLAKLLQVNHTETAIIDRHQALRDQDEPFSLSAMLAAEIAEAEELLKQE